MSARDDILGRIHSAAGRPTPATADARAAYEEAVGSAAPRPQWRDARRDRFLERLEAAAATWAAVPDASAVPEAVGHYLVERELPQVLHLAPHPRLDGMTWPEGWTVNRGTGGLAESRITVTVARFGIAETGTLMMPGGAAAPPSMNLLAEHHLVVLDSDDLVDYQEQAWNAFRRENDALPRAVMMVTGPSRTADIEQTLQLGAHGLRNLHVLLLGG